jgi:hypothetical protein
MCFSDDYDDDDDDTALMNLSKSPLFSLIIPPHNTALGFYKSDHHT